VIEPEQLDIFIPLHRREQFDAWAQMAVENDMDVAEPGGAGAFARWLRDHGQAPAGLSQETLTVLVAAMGEYAADGRTKTRGLC
jgi:hypothetical protein